MSIRQDFIVARLVGRSYESDLHIEIGHFSQLDARDVRQHSRCAVCRDCPTIRRDVFLGSMNDLAAHIKTHIDLRDRVPPKIGKALETAGRFFEAKP